MNYYNQPSQGYYPDAMAVDNKVSAVMKKVYVKMFLALLVSAAAAYLGAVAGEGVLAYALATNSWIYWGLGILELLLVFFISARIGKMSPAMSSGLFYLFAIVNGLTLSIIFLVFSFASIFKTFLITAGVFGAMSVYGYFTNRDLTKIGSFLFMALIGLIIATLVNLFVASSTLDWIISFAGVIIFVGLTAWDTQQIKNMASMMPADQHGRLATLGALSLYLDFINLFLYLLRFFGSSRD